MENRSESLRKMPLFKGMGDSDLAVIAAVSVKKHVEKGDHIFFRGDPQEAVYFIEQGEVKIYRTDANGKEQIVTLLRDGDMFPHVGFFRKIRYPANSMAATDTELLAARIADFEKVLLDNPKLTMTLYGVMSDEILDLQDRLEAQILNNAYEQVIKLFLRLARTHGIQTGNDHVLVKIPLNNSDLASMIGVTRETVSRTIHQLKHKNLIIPQEKGTYLIHQEKLTNELLGV
ncbi:Crp/Fnr family transcriptional regulator [Weizmannia acidilactici]|uniref:Crp/Fnr family transcriptional regulator n=1 Tax=Weizmannia acidilactici TaxID=2607726 RepID=UPI00127BEC61|nr:Crp/Fnr family transcriptional regulator [Weizmannia acidilactici]GER72861.1 Crp/Fnr family transcriptional regulator [Weizmannia acidilactici]